MSFWMEIRCDSDRTDGACWSNKNNGPMESSPHTRDRIRATVRRLETAARKEGWKRTRDGWFCPVCAFTPPVVSS